MNTLVIIGASGHGKVVADAALASRAWDDIVFLDARWPELTHCGPWPVVGSDERQPLADAMPFMVAIGQNATRLRLQTHFQKLGWTPQTIVHPAAHVSPFAHIGAGSILCAASVIGPFAILGQACIINTAATVDHDCNLGNGVHVSPGTHIAGETVIGDRTWIGLGTSVIQNLSIAADIVVGAGSTVVANLDLPGLYVGTPVKHVVKQK